MNENSTKKNIVRKKKRFHVNTYNFLSFTLNAHFFKLLLSDGSEMNGKLFYACYPIKTRKHYIIPLPYLSIRLKKKMLFVIRLFFYLYKCILLSRWTILEFFCVLKWDFCLRSFLSETTETELTSLCYHDDL